MLKSNIFTFSQTRNDKKSSIRSACNYSAFDDTTKRAVLVITFMTALNVGSSLLQMKSKLAKNEASLSLMRDNI
jgi:hypothetical protein